MIDRWAQPDGKAWDAECSDYAGFARLMDEPGQIVDQKYYVNEIVAHIHQRFSQFLKNCLSNPKSPAAAMKTKCALKILYRIRAVFPKERVIAQSICDELSKIMALKAEIQADVWTLTSRYHADLSELVKELPVSSRHEARAAAAQQANQRVPANRTAEETKERERPADNQEP